MPSSLGFRVGGQFYSNFPASTVKGIWYIVYGILETAGGLVSGSK